MKMNLTAVEPGEVEAGLELIESNLGNTLAILDGYAFLREEIERVNKWYATPKNTERLKFMRQENEPS
jgi:hypothetical protein